MLFCSCYCLTVSHVLTLHYLLMYKAFLTSFIFAKQDVYRPEHHSRYSDLLRLGECKVWTPVGARCL